ncbi:MAG: ABC transporter ATP-binding protein [Nitrospirae bacterium]|nr:ABC transporter ATP-binding protein [Nitrospirota bacterium]
MGNVVIKTVNLTKVFKAGFRGKNAPALKGLNLEVNEGEIFGFLGPNGAGKTTTIKILMGLIYPTTGNAWILDKEVTDIEVKNRIGFLPEQPYFYDYLTSKEFLRFYGQLFGLKGDELRTRMNDLLTLVGLEGAANLQLRKFSKGMLQRIGIAQALINQPDLIVLDEPMSGLDPVGRKEIRDIILRLKEDGKTVFFSTHIIPDVEMICDRVGILMKGELVNVGRRDEIINASVKYVEIITGNISKELIDHMEAMGFIVNETWEHVSIMVKDENRVDAVLQMVMDGKGRIVSVAPQRETLEEYFMKKIGGTS